MNLILMTLGPLVPSLYINMMIITSCYACPILNPCTLGLALCSSMHCTSINRIIIWIIIPGINILITIVEEW